MTRIERVSQIEVAVIRDVSDLLTAMDIRRAVFVDEYGCSEEEEFDGNDFSATQIIARVHGRAAGTMRLRYFNGFVIPERLAVLPEFRKSRYGARGLAFAIATFGFNLARMKGYRQFVGYSVLGLERFWDHIAMASDGRVEKYGDHPVECSGSVCIGVFGALDAIRGGVDGREDYHLLMANEGDLPAIVAQRAADILAHETRERELAALAAERAREERLLGLQLLMGDVRGHDRRGNDRRAEDRRAGDRRAQDRRAGDWWSVAGTYAEDRRSSDRRQQDRRAANANRRAGDRRDGDRRQATAAAEAQGQPLFERSQVA